MIKIFWQRNKIIRQRILFLEQLAIILQSGLPLLRGMELLSQRSDKTIVPLCYRMHQRLARGSSLAAAMKEESRFFPTLTVSLVRAGEESGALENVLEQLSQYYKMQEEMRGFVFKSLAYPGFLLVAAIAVFLFFMLYVLPSLGAAYESMGVHPRGMLSAILHLQQFVVGRPASSFVLFLFALTILSYGIRQLITRMLRMPRFGNILGHIQEVRFCRILALLLESGMNITQAVDLIKETMDSRQSRHQLELLNGRLVRGFDISVAVKATTGFFSPLTCDLIMVGAATGYLPKMLAEAATIGERDLKTKLLKIKEYLAPLLLAVVALVIAVVVSVVVGPLLEIITAMPE